jgi:hypothetical protein
LVIGQCALDLLMLPYSGRIQQHILGRGLSLEQQTLK